jgi:sec-independent protein translocase protein TatC
MADTDDNKSGKKKQGEMSFLEHLEELRWHLIRSVLAIVIMAVVAFILKDFIFNTIIFKPKTPDFWTNRMFAQFGDFIGSEAIKINSQDLQLISIKMAGQFLTHIWTALVAGFIIASPIVFLSSGVLLNLLFTIPKSNMPRVQFFLPLCFLC